jgi:hypothetical protein
MSSPRFSRLSPRPPLARLLSLLAAALLLAGAAAAEARRDEGQFDVYVAGVRAGVLVFGGVVEDGTYAAHGKIESTGLLARFLKVRYDAKSWGRVIDGRLQPASYVETANTGKRQSQAVMAYVAGVPQVKEYNPPRKSGKTVLDPATQAGTLDPMSVIYAALRNVPEDEVCTLKVQMFDGARRSQVTLGKPNRDGDSVTCAGEYRRLAGFSEKEMAEQVSYPFTLTYLRQPDGMFRVEKMTTSTDIGTASLIRRK